MFRVPSAFSKFGAVWALAGLPLAALSAGPAPAGADLYTGRVPMQARVRGHEQALPAAAARCTNCHEAAAREADLNSGAAAPPLNRSTLVASLRRRGGPASSFDESSFCHLLRTGVDPAQVLVRKAMPQFVVTAAECRVLWQYLSQREALLRGAQ